MIGTPTRAEYRYVQQLKFRLAACSHAFERVAELEKLALDDKNLVRDNLWRREYLLAMNRFRIECLTLGRIPDAPPGYEDGDIWIRQAATKGARSAELHLEAIQKMEQGLMDAGVELFRGFQECIRQVQKCFPLIFTNRKVGSRADHP